jgi:glutathione reductase (NADPH)
MRAFDFDLFTIGAGSGGVAASRRASASGARVAIAEERRVGGTCVLRGCVPKKLLVYASHLREEMADAAGYGWDVAEPALDWGKLIERKDRELDRLNGVYVRMLHDAGVAILEGRATIEDAHTVRVGAHRYSAERILVATGGAPVVPPWPGREHVITSDEALSLPALPRRAVIVGGGYIAVEFASIFAAAGAHVTLLLRGREVLRGFDDDIRAALTDELARKGIEIQREAQLRAIERTPGGAFKVALIGGEQVEGDVVLAATGRAPSTRGLGIEDAGVRLDARGAICVDAWSQSSAPSVYAVGDVTDRVNLTPVAIAEGRAFAETVFHGRPMTVAHDAAPSAVFSQPPVATVGLSEEEARRRHGAVVVYRTRFSPMKYALSGREERSMMKVVVDRATDRVVGFHMVGLDAPEIIQGFAAALTCGITKAQLDATIGIHPTSAEELVTLREPLPEAPRTDG